jgi:uncharacterized glyoxalase superfamily protein PhnB
VKERIIPSIRYQDSKQAIDWLCATFGFEHHLIVPNEDGGITHAELVCGEAMIMLGGHTDGDDAFGKLNRSPCSWMVKIQQEFIWSWRMWMPTIRKQSLQEQK